MTIWFIRYPSLRISPELRAKQFQFIMVDEFQDTNLAQLRLPIWPWERRQSKHHGSRRRRPSNLQLPGADVGNIRFANIITTQKSLFWPTIIVPPRTFYHRRGDVITQGADRLENTIDGLSKQLTAHANSEGSKSKSKNSHLLVKSERELPNKLPSW